MLPPHWLDEVFAVPENAVKVLLETDRFKEAVAKAQAAFYEAQESQKKNPMIMGPSPAQQARNAFLESINAD